MASGESLFTFFPQGSEPPGSAAALEFKRNGHLTIAFEDTTDKDMVWPITMPRNYDGGGITASVHWLAASATTGTNRLQGAFERHEEDVTDLDADSFDSFQSNGEAPASGSGEPQVTVLTFTNSQIDGLLAGESGRFKLRRDADGTSGTDDMVGDAQVTRVECQET